MLVVPLGTVAAGGTPGVGALASVLAAVPVISCCNERVGTEALGVRVLVAWGLLGVVEVSAGLASGVLTGGGLVVGCPEEALVLSWLDDCESCEDDDCAAGDKRFVTVSHIVACR